MKLSSNTECSMFVLLDATVLACIKEDAFKQAGSHCKFDLGKTLNGTKD